MSMSKEVDLAHAQRPVPCDACENEVPGTYYCIQCKKTLCEECEKFHKKITTEHSVVPRSQIAEIDTSTLSCTDHEGEAFFHCEKCNVPVCPECVTGKHQGHKMANLKDIMERKKGLLQGEIDEILNVVLPNLTRQEETNERDRENYNMKIKQLTIDMEDENKIIHQELDRIHNERIESLKDTQRTQLSLFDGRSAEIRMMKDICKSRVSEYQDALRKNQIHAINSLVERKKNLPVVQSKGEVPKIPSFEPMDIHRIVENLRKQRMSPHSLIENPIIISKFQCPVKGKPRIYTTKEGNVWLGGNEARTLVKVDIKGKILQKRKIRTAPYTLVQMDSGDLIYIPQNQENTPVIKVTADDRESYLFDPSPSSSHGISVTVDQNLLICTVDGRVVRTDSYGTDIKQIYQGSGLHSAKHAIENADGDIYITDHRKTALMILDKDGKVRSKIRHTTKGQPLLYPIGLVADSIGNIFCADLDSHCVYIIDQNLKMAELVGRSHGIQYPTWLAVDDQNNLWLTQKDGSILVVKYMG